MSLRRLAPLLAAIGLAGALTASAGGLVAPEKPTLWTDLPRWTTATSATFNFSSPGAASFICRLDSGAAGWVPCTSPVAYDSLGEGGHTFQVRALDGSGDESPPTTFEWTTDLTPPSLPGDLLAEAAAPSGAVVVFAALDNLDPSPLLDCAPASASIFPLGTTTVSCTATDAAGNASPTGTFAVTVRDTTPPTLAPHADVIAAQQSQQGAVVDYALPVAQDAADPSPAVTCDPPAGSTFPLGVTEVTCTATDAAGLRSAATSFDVVVQAGPAPALPAIVADVPRLTNRSDASFRVDVEADAAAECRLDGPLGPGSFAPCSGDAPQAYSGLVDGSYLFTVQVTNAIGNRRQASYAWTVDLTAPAPVAGFAARAGNRVVRLSWAKPADADYDRVRIWRKRAGSTWRRLADRVTAGSFADRAVANHVSYRYRVATLDAAGNVATPVEAGARPSPILAPAWGAVVHAPPLVDWTSVRRATYYNMQVWRDGRKILSVWPLRSRYRLRSTWTFRGKRYSLAEGRTTVYVWPGFGSKAAVRYGGLLGWTTFRIG
ncbi:MAG TPA: HYR domain-containing protein [Gaiellaceae bacterium]|nr:HYR domain-containing protein [Gaiellaceae bacterium]